MKAKTILYAAILVTVTVMVTIAALYTVTSADVFAPKYLVHVRSVGESGMRSSARARSVFARFLSGESLGVQCIEDYSRRQARKRAMLSQQKEKGRQFFSVDFSPKVV